MSSLRKSIWHTRGSQRLVPLPPQGKLKVRQDTPLGAASGGDGARPPSSSDTGQQLAWRLTAPACWCITFVVGCQAWDWGLGAQWGARWTLSLPSQPRRRKK